MIWLHYLLKELVFKKYVYPLMPFYSYVTIKLIVKGGNFSKCIMVNISGVVGALVLW